MSGQNSKHSKNNVERIIFNKLSNSNNIHVENCTSLYFTRNAFLFCIITKT